MPRSGVRLVAAASTDRDRLLLSAMYDLGLRIGPSLGLRHSDLDPMRRRVRIVRRDDINGPCRNNGPSSPIKRPAASSTCTPATFSGEIADLDSDYVFVNLARHPIGAPLTYSNAYQLIEHIGAVAGIDDLHRTYCATPTPPLWPSRVDSPRDRRATRPVAPSSADVYIHLAGDDLSDKAPPNRTPRLAQPSAPTTRRGNRIRVNEPA